MRDLRDLLSGSLHIERIVFAHDEFRRDDHEPNQEPSDRKETHFYLGASSNDRLLLVELPSLAAGPVDLLKLAPWGVVAARIPESDFNYAGALLFPQPRPSTDPNWEGTFQSRIHPLTACLRLFILEAKPGSFRWDGDRFTAEYTDKRKGQRNGFGAGAGPYVPGSAERKIFAYFFNSPKEPGNRPGPMKVIEQELDQDGKILWSSDGNLEPIPIRKPSPGSIDERIKAARVVQHEARMARGLTGHAVRDAQGSVSEIRLDDDHYRIELEYAPSAALPRPWPHKIKKVWSRDHYERPPATQEMTIYAARVSDQPPGDAAFHPWRFLKKGTYVRGEVSEGTSTVAHRKDAGLWRKLMEFRTAQWDTFQGAQGD